MKNELISDEEQFQKEKGQGHFFQVIFKDIYFLRHNSVCHKCITHAKNILIYATFHLSNLKACLHYFLSNFYFFCK